VFQTRSSRPTRQVERLHAAGAALAAGGIYVATLTPSISWGDSPELTAAAYQLGIPHPTGYPLYMLLAHAAIHLLPFGDVAHRVNLFSALCAAGAVGVMHRLATHLTRSLVGGWAAALTLALAPLFWSQAVIAEVYPLAALLTLSLFLQVLLWDQTGDLRHLKWAAFLTGLNLAHHLTISLLAPGLILFALTSRHRREGLRRLPQLVGLMLLPLLLYLYLPIRAREDPWINWGDTQTFPALLYHATGRFYKAMMFATPPEEVMRRARELPSLGLQNLGWPGLLLALGGMVALLWRPFALLSHAFAREPRDLPTPEFLDEAWTGWRLAWLLACWIVLSLIWGLGYYVFDYSVFYLPALEGLSLLAGVGAAALVAGVAEWTARGRRQTADGGRRTENDARPSAVRRPPSAVRHPVPFALSALLLTLLAYPVFTRWKENDQHDDWSALRYARAITQILPPEALVFGFGDYDWFGLFYVHAVEGACPDALIFNLWETTRPQSYRLFARYRSSRFVVLPVPGFGLPGPQRSPYDFLHSLLDANIRRRPLVFVVSPGTLEEEEIKQILSPYYAVKHSNLDPVEYYPIQPQFAVEPAEAAGKGLGFVDGTRLEEFAATYETETGVQWVHVKYRWSVAHSDPGDRLQVRLWLSDRNGHYRPVGAGAAIEDEHPLGYGYLPLLPPGRRALVNEERWLFVHAEDAGQPYQVRMSLLRNGRVVPRLTGDRISILQEITIPRPPPCEPGGK
jgi:hypothetical protein